MTPILRTLARAGAPTLATCATIVAAVVVFEERLIYFPSRHPDGWWDTAALARETGCVIEDRTLAAADGVRLHGWWCVPSASDAPTAAMALLWLHGNAGNLSHRADMLARLLTLPVRVLIVDYRGYGSSEGRPDEAGLYADARGAWGELTGPLGVPPERWSSSASRSAAPLPSRSPPRCGPPVSSCSRRSPRRTTWPRGCFR